MFCKKDVLRIFRRKHLRQSLCFNKVAGLRPATFTKIETLPQVLSCELLKIFKDIPFLTEHLRWLLLNSKNWPQGLFNFFIVKSVDVIFLNSLTYQILLKAKTFWFAPYNHHWYYSICSHVTKNSWLIYQSLLLALFSSFIYLHSPSCLPFTITYF